MNRRWCCRVLACLLVAVTACSKIERINAPRFTSGSANFSRYAAIGTSLSSGGQSGGGLEEFHQRRSFTADFARQIGARFTLPTFSPAGFPQLYTLVSLAPLTICTDCRTDGVPTNLNQATAYDNMAVPGALLLDVADSSSYYDAGIRGLTQKQRFDWIVRHRGTLLSEVASLDPTFVTFEMGANEVLGPALGGSGLPLMNGPQYQALLHATLDALTAAVPGVKLAIFTVPDVTSIPYVTTIKPYVVNPATGQPVLTPGGQNIPLIGSDGPLHAGDYVLLPAAVALAQGIGVPVAQGGTGNPLDHSLVLTAEEAANLEATVDEYNTAVTAEATARGAALVDLHALLNRIATTGIRYHGTTYTSAFITGGVFSLDGVHPNDFAHGLIANTIIDAVNAKFGSTVPNVLLDDVASTTASAMRRSAPRTKLGYPEFEDEMGALRNIVPVPAVMVAGR